METSGKYPEISVAKLFPPYSLGKLIEWKLTEVTKLHASVYYLRFLPTR